MHEERLYYRPMVQNLSLRRRLALILAGIIAVEAIAALALFMALVALHSRVVELPRPSGPYPVGRVVYDWIDRDRQETLGGPAGAPREIGAWIWYPASPAGQPSAPYLPAAWAAARERTFGPFFLLMPDYARVRSHAFAGAPPASSPNRFPVLIMQPGLGPIIQDYASLAEDLASRGYVVVGLNPTYSAAVSVFPNGRVALASQAGNIPDVAAPDVVQKRSDELVDIWAGDVRFAMDQLAALDTAPDMAFLLAGRLDLGHIGVFGHSFGGASAAEVCSLDERCRAGADLDGWLFGAVAKPGARPLAQPFLFLWSEEDLLNPAAAENGRINRAIYDRAAGGVYWLTLRGARHFNFADLAVLYAPLLHVQQRFGPIDGVRGLRVTADYLAAFFDQTLRGTSSPLLAGPSQAYPEIQFEKQAPRR